ncbi:hypothetical protein M0813_23863 [Anaeramoeba flamelloides]|uniref:BTB domain-containing protein n=1 Tax=Anaeramoeba flamelloides TaxID=1746091 RepID=A0ABQ8Y825_9EUKA|nr:hypothetical protein M0813_23863 [Anaeramoeba flamelloides]
MQKTFISLGLIRKILNLKTVEELKISFSGLNPSCRTTKIINPHYFGVTNFLGKDKFLSLFHILCLNANLTTSMLDYVYKCDSNFIKALSQQKMNPFHYFCLNKKVSLPLLKWFLEGKSSKGVKKTDGAQAILKQESLTRWNPFYYLCSNRYCKDPLIFKYVINKGVPLQRTKSCPIKVLKRSRNDRQFARISKAILCTPFSLIVSNITKLGTLLSIFVNDPNLTNTDLQEIRKYNLSLYDTSFSVNAMKFLIQRSKANLPIPFTLFTQILSMGYSLQDLIHRNPTIELMECVFESERSVKKQEIIKKVKSVALKKKKLNYLKKLKYPNIYQLHQSIENLSKDRNRLFFTMLKKTPFSDVVFSTNTIREDLEKGRAHGLFCDWEIDKKAVAHSLFLRKRFGVDPKILKQKLLSLCSKEEIDFFLQEAYLNSTINKKKLDLLLQKLEINPKNVKDPEIVVEDLWVEKTQSDFCLIAQDKNIRTHKFILAARSNLFESFFQISEQNMKSLTDQSKSCIQTLHVFFRFLYTGHLLINFNEKISNQVLEELHCLNEYYQLNLNSPYEKLLQSEKLRLKKKFKVSKAQKDENNRTSDSINEKKINKGTKAPLTIQDTTGVSRVQSNVNSDLKSKTNTKKSENKIIIKRKLYNNSTNEKKIIKNTKTNTNENNEKKLNYKIKKRRGRGKSRGKKLVINRMGSSKEISRKGNPDNEKYLRNGNGKRNGGGNEKKLNSKIKKGGRGSGKKRGRGRKRGSKEISRKSNLDNEKYLRNGKVKETGGEKENKSLDPEEIKQRIQQEEEEMERRIEKLRNQRLEKERKKLENMDPEERKALEEKKAKAIRDKQLMEEEERKFKEEIKKLQGKVGNSEISVFNPFISSSLENNKKVHKIEKEGEKEKKKIK